ncbi:MAG TPA: glycosyltransferase [Vicinamibacterales bacterium]|nr:glycosyltransferase [Vicinamibacterales bacterium]
MSRRPRNREAEPARSAQAPVRVLYVQHADPAGYPPVVHSVAMLADAGAEIRMLGLNIFEGRLQMPVHDGVRVTLRKREQGRLRIKAAFAAFTAQAAGLALAWRPDWVYASDALAAPAARLISLATRSRVIYHEHDTVVRDETTSRFMRRILDARNDVVRRAEVCVVPNEDRAAYLASVTGRQGILTVWNTPSLREVTETPKMPTSGALRLAYHGSIVPARVPMTVVDALARLPDCVTFVVTGYETSGHLGYATALQQRAHAAGVGRRLTVRLEVPREELLELARASDVGLSLMPNETRDLNERHMVGASNKPFEYLASGLPLLVSDLPDWRRTFVEPGFGLACNPASAASIAERLRWYLHHPAERGSMGAAGRRQVIDAWHYERGFAPVLDRMRISAATPDVTRRRAS